MELHIHRYQLPWSSQFSRKHSGQGALLKVACDGAVGFADLHPWTSLGDRSIDDQIHLWQMGNPTQQLQLSLEFARRDSEARKNKLVGVKYFPQVENHNLLLEAQLTIATIHDRFATAIRTNKPIVAKWKIAPERTIEAQHFLNAVTHDFPSISWRLDANALFTAKEIHSFWAGLSATTRRHIQFIEDPCRYDFENWNNLEEEGIPLAIDFEINRWQQASRGSSKSQSPTRSGNTTFVFKPAIQDMHAWRDWLQQNPHHFLFTSYLDHPVGMLHALWTAETFYSEFPNLAQINGLNLPLTQEELTAFWPGLKLNTATNPAWTGSAESGIGFQDCLEKLEWQFIGTN